MPELHITPTAEEAAQSLGELMVRLSRDSLAERGRFIVALSGGATPRRLYQLLASPSYAGRVAWGRWHVFWSDERCVPPDHPDSNYRLARQALLDRVPIPPENIHRVRGDLAAADAAREYEGAVVQAFPDSQPAFDLILLGIGEDGHTASLFAATVALAEERRLVVASWVFHLQASRITFTLPLINDARAVAFLATDGAKAEAVRRVLQPAPGESTLPASLVRPAHGALHWFLTRDAARLLGAVTAP